MTNDSPSPVSGGPRAHSWHIPFGFSRVGWKGALREFVLIVAGVFAALTGNSWWEGRQDLRRERAYLVQLHNDLQAAEAVLDSARTAEGRAVQQTIRMRLLLQSSGDAPPFDSIQAWLTISGSVQTVPLAGTLSALIETGDMRLMRNEELRTALISYHESMRADQAVMDALRAAFLARSYEARVELEPYIVYAPALWQDSNVPIASFDVEGMRRDPELRAAYSGLNISRGAMFTVLSRALGNTTGLIKRLATPQ